MFVFLLGHIGLTENRVPLKKIIWWFIPVSKRLITPVYPSCIYGNGVSSAIEFAPHGPKKLV